MPRLVLPRFHVTSFLIFARCQKAATTFAQKEKNKLQKEKKTPASTKKFFFERLKTFVAQIFILFRREMAAVGVNRICRNLASHVRGQKVGPCWRLSFLQNNKKQ